MHVTAIGPTRSGKTHIMLTLLDMTAHSLIIGTKRKDPLLSQMAARGDHLITSDPARDVIWAADQTPIHKKVIFWPKFPDNMSSQQRTQAQARMIRKVLDWADRTGGWAILIDELMWVNKNLRLEKEIESAYFQGRTQGVSVLGCAQRPSHVPLLAFSQADYLFLSQSSDKRDIERLREISSGFSKELIEDTVRQLNWERHEFLFIDTRRKELARVVAPPR